MEFSVNIPCLFGRMPLEDALRKMMQHGYDRFELWSLREGQDEEIKRCIGDTGARLTAFCPDFFILNDPARREEYRASLKRAIQTAKRLSCPSLITQVGQDTGAPREQQHSCIVEGLKEMAPLLEDAGITLLIEPLNDVKDHRGYFLTDSREGFEIVRETGSQNVKLLYDVYHQLHMGEDVSGRIAENLGLIGHFHVAGFPDRNEKIFENYDYSALLRLIQESGTKALVGLELFCTPEKSLELLEKLRKYQSPV